MAAGIPAATYYGEIKFELIDYSTSLLYTHCQYRFYRLLLFLYKEGLL